jgi:hypothetical protein
MQNHEPDFWLVLELDGELKAVDPTHLATGEQDVDLLVGVALGYHEGHPGRRLVFMSDLTQWLASVGLDWARLDADVDELVRVALEDSSVQLACALGCNLEHAEPPVE